jgi:hypothetical protein
VVRIGIGISVYSRSFAGQILNETLSRLRQGYDGQARSATSDCRGIRLRRAYGGQVPPLPQKPRGNALAVSTSLKVPSGFDKLTAGCVEGEIAFHLFAGADAMLR